MRSGDGKNLTPVINTQLTADQQQEMERIVSEFKHVFDTKPGMTRLTEHRIQTGSAKPVRQTPYRLPHAYRETVQKGLAEMEKDGIIEPSTSEWASPIVLVPKKDGSLRMCVDYRRLNSVSEADAYPIPRIDDLIDRLGDARYISALDLTQGYWQVPVAPQACSRTAFTSLYQFTVMPQLLFSVLWTCCSKEYAKAYLDDLVTYYSQHNERKITTKESIECGLMAGWALIRSVKFGEGELMVS